MKRIEATQVPLGRIEKWESSLVKPATGRGASVFTQHPYILEEFGLSFDRIDSIPFRDLAEVSESLMAGYARLVERGHPREAVGAAMMGGLVNLYNMFDMQADLPGLLRVLADRIEHDAADSN